MTRILFFLPSLTGGGAERTLVNIANGLSNKKYEVHFLIIDRPLEGKYKDEYYYLLDKRVRIHNLNMKIFKLNYLFIILGMRKVISKVNPDIVFSTMLRPNIMLVAALIISRYRGKVVLRESNNRTATKTSRLERQIVKFIYGTYADKVVSLSEGVKKDLIKNFRIPEKKIIVIYNPVDIDYINEQKKEYLDLQAGNVLVAAGRLTLQKNYFCLIEALKILSTSIDFKMYILGKGELKDSIDEKIKEAGLTEKIKLIGFMKNPYKYIAKAKAFILSSDWEGFGHVIVEAMACGTAVISTDCPYGPNEIITDHKNGILVPVNNPEKLANSISEVLLHSDLRTTLELEGLKRAQTFSKKMIVKQYENLFDEIILI